jgi:tetratricopeptide (TPR) repeat protein
MASSLVKVEYQDTKTNKGFDAEVQNSGKFEVGLSPIPKFPVGIVVDPKEGYKDYVVMNEYEVGNVIAGSSVDVKMCKGADVDTLRIIYYKVNINRLNEAKDVEKEKLRKEYENIKEKAEEYAQKLIALENKYAYLEKFAYETSQKLSIAEIENQMLKSDPAYMTDIISKTFDNNENIKKAGLLEGDYEKIRGTYGLEVVRKRTEERKKQEEIDKKQILSDIGYQKILGDYDLAIIYYTYIIDTLETDNRYKFLYNYEAAELCYLINDFDTANSFINAALKLNNSVNQKYLVKTYNLSGEIKNAINENKYHNEYQKAINLYKQFKKDEFEDSEIEKEAAISYILLGDYFKQKEKNESAKANYHKALDIYTELNKIEEIEIEAQYLILVKLIGIYNAENKESMVKKCNERIKLLEDKDNTITKNPKINLQLAVVSMQTGDFSDANGFYTMALNHYKNNNSNHNQQEIIETMFLTGLNHFYAKSYKNALDYFNQTNDLLSRDSILIGKTDFIRLKALNTAAMGIVKKKSGDKENGLKQYNKAIEFVKKAELNKNDKKLILKDMAHLKNYSKLKTIDIIIKSAGGILGYGLLFIPLI